MFRVSCIQMCSSDCIKDNLKRSEKLIKKAISQKINNISVNKVHVIGKDIKETFKKINLNKQGTILNNDSEINDLIKQELKNGDYLMIKGSNSTGLFNYASKLKKRSINVI